MTDDAQAIRAAIDSYQHHTFTAGESEGLLIDYGDGPLFACRGTEFNGSLILFGDALIDALAIPWKRSPLGWGHKGFMVGRLVPDCNEAGAVGLYWQAAGALHSLPQAPIICGHSKGGAEALFIGALLTAHGRPPKAIITAGCPKGCLGDTVADILRAVPIRNHVIDGDPVPGLPKMPYWNRPGQVIMHPRQYQIGIYNHKGAAYKAALH